MRFRNWLRRHKNLRLVGFAIAVTALHIFVMEFSLFTQPLPYLFWPSLLVRLAALVLAAPAFGVGGFLDLNFRLVVPIEFILAAWYLTVLLIGERAYLLYRAMKNPPRLGRRTLFLGSGAVALGTVALCQGARELIVRREVLSLRDLPKSLHNLKICLLADLHRGPATTKEFLQEVVDQVNNQKPDVILLPGDFISKSARYFDDVEELLAQLTPRIGSFATLGNHDHWEGAGRALQSLEKVGIHTLQNRQLMINEHSQIVESATTGLCLAGVDDYWVGKPNIQDALGGSPQDVPVILLSHNPDVAEIETEQDYRVDLRVSGHTHGGQIVLPGLGPCLTASRYGTKYLAGWAQGPRWPVFTTVGVGTSMVPVRLGTTPEIVCFQVQGISGETKFEPDRLS